MAERAASKAKRASQRDSVAPDRGGDRTALVRERDVLKAELEAAKARIAALEQQRDQIVNRIDWIIDSLHSLIEDDR